MSIIPKLKNPEVKEYLSKICTDYFDQRTPESHLVHLVDKVQGVLYGADNIFSKYADAYPEEVKENIVGYSIPSHTKAIEAMKEKYPDEELHRAFDEIQRRCLEGAEKILAHIERINVTEEK